MGQEGAGQHETWLKSYHIISKFPIKVFSILVALFFLISPMYSLVFKTLTR